MKHALITCTLIALAGLCFGQAVKPLIIGEAHEIQSMELGEKRTLNIYLPDGYNPADTAAYSVIYLLDGGMDEDFLHVAGLVQFNSFPWVGRLQPSIVVGIVNTDRKRDFTFPTGVKGDKAKYPTTGSSAKFITFIEKELQPYIQHRFRVNGNRTIIGESLGGLLATEVLLTRPYLFNKYIIISPSLWWNNGSLLKNPAKIPAGLIKGNTTVYIGVGKEGLAPSEEPHVMEVDAGVLEEQLKQNNISQLSVFLDYLPGENHATIAHQALLNAIKWMGGK